MKTICIFLWISFFTIGCIPAKPKSEVPTLVRIINGQSSSIKKGASEIIIGYEGFTVSYSPEMFIPNWVSYELTACKTEGPFSRKGKNFQQDSRVSVSQADAHDYRGSGWSRGHMAPAADFKWNDTAMTETFYYTNICPQNHELNNRYWNTLENNVRRWANQFGRVFVVTGPIINRNIHGKIGHHGVVVPDAFFKVILAQTDVGWTSIAFVMDNTSDSRLFKDCATTVNAVEALTGIDFFPLLDDSVEEEVEGILDYKTWKVY